MKRDMTSGNVMVSLLWFVVPLAIGNILQQLYNIIDTYIVAETELKSRFQINVLNNGNRHIAEETAFACV